MAARTGAAGRLDERLAAIAGTEGRELSGLAVVAVEDDRTVYEGYFGHRYIDPEDGSRSLPVDGRTKFRIASMSKPVVGIGAMLLVERGLLDLDADLSDYLGFALRNPSYPEDRITCAMLLGHVSSIRDADRYNLPLPLGLRELLLPGGAFYEDGAHFAAPPPGADLRLGPRPGRHYRYSNLNYGILGTVIERIAGRRFDLYMRDEVLRPLGLEAGFNLLHLGEEGVRHLAALYRKADPDDEDDTSWDPKGPWKAQFDDHRGRLPAIAWRSSPGLGPEALDGYEIGTNGTLFSPQGGLRVSAPGLAKVMRLFMNGGEVDGTRLLSRGSVETMTTARWRYDPDAPNGDLDGAPLGETGLGLMREATFIGGADETGGGGGGGRADVAGPRYLWGHHGDAYGLLGSMLFDAGRRRGLVYVIGGTAVPPAQAKGASMSHNVWEEGIQRAVSEELWEGRGA